MGELQNHAVEIIREVKKAVVGKDDVIEQIMTAIIGGGHILIEDMLGSGKRRWHWHFPKRWEFRKREYSLRRM